MKKNIDNMIKIISTIFVFSKKDFQKQFDSLKNTVKLFQIDIVDGNFVKTKNNISPALLKGEKNKIELHLMVEKPINYLKKWQECKNVVRVLIHTEILEKNNFEEIYNFCKKQKWELGLVINPNTNINKAKNYLKFIKTFMFMGVIPGKQGQKFDIKVLDKIKRFKKQNPNIKVALDGGIKLNNAKKIIDSGVENLCIGSAILCAEDPKEAYKSFTQLTKK